MVAQSGGDEQIKGVPMVARVPQLLVCLVKDHPCGDTGQSQGEDQSRGQDRDRDRDLIRRSNHFCNLASAQPATKGRKLPGVPERIAALTHLR